MKIYDVRNEEDSKIVCMMLALGLEMEAKNDTTTVWGQTSWSKEVLIGGIKENCWVETLWRLKEPK